MSSQTITKAPPLRNGLTLFQIRKASCLYISHFYVRKDKNFLCKLTEIRKKLGDSLPCAVVYTKRTPACNTYILKLHSTKNLTKSLLGVGYITASNFIKLLSSGEYTSTRKFLFQEFRFVTTVTQKNAPKKLTYITKVIKDAQLPGPTKLVTAGKTLPPPPPKSKLSRAPTMPTEPSDEDNSSTSDYDLTPEEQTPPLFSPAALSL
nr:hypothetical protein [uncultured bacterium]AUH21339.1 hypothetical protein [uncultured bacterium]AUH21345.1 hypothetical protein [uncultured bacterium]